MKILEFRSNQILFLGDTHGVSAIFDLLADLHIPAGSDVVHVGDVGLGFGESRTSLNDAEKDLKRLSEFAVAQDIRFFLNRGNHDNPDVWKFESIFSNIFLVNTGDISAFPNGKIALFVGGGISIDRHKRDSSSYWPDEITEDLSNVPQVDFVFSHDCPPEYNLQTHSLKQSHAFCVENDSLLIEDCIKQRERMKNIIKKSGAHRIVYGHYHNSHFEAIDGLTARCVNICELYPFNSEV